MARQVAGWRKRIALHVLVGQERAAIRRDPGRRAWGNAVGPERRGRRLRAAEALSQPLQRYAPEFLRVLVRLVKASLPGVVSQFEFLRMSCRNPVSSPVCLAESITAKVDKRMDTAELRQQLQTEIERAEASVAFWRRQMDLQNGTPFEFAVGQALQSYKVQVDELHKAQRFLDHA